MLRYQAPSIPDKRARSTGGAIATGMEERQPEGWNRVSRAEAEGLIAYAAKAHGAAPMERIEIIKDLVPARQAKWFIQALSLPVSDAYRLLHLSPATVNRKAKNDDRLTQDESERVVGLARLIGQVQAMVEESGEPEGFDVSAWTSRWLTQPLPALGGRRPMDLMDTMEGQALVSSVVGRMQSGAYA